MKTLYLDMDGVLTDFNKRYAELFGQSAADSRERKEFTDHWRIFIEGRNFATLEWWHNGKELLSFVDTLKDVNIEILSSSGGHRYHEEVTAQKKQWLSDNNIKFKQNITPGSRLKSGYAKGSQTILVDDTDYVIEGFINKGGIGILHRDIGETIRLIKEALSE